ncbi:hypothetical protein TSAR_007721 [Trichomalopsis sarcophagae]|uniref:Aminotransferase class I/classII large domain-containing protein n=1 Tax=Trichomalopsis sarcophagae TaxID=543379 RepID=A0A232EKX3_9HYME|nr:hypothetical protein TSAR_007721 [Trichomalopsis sarcophagae]
MVIKKCIMDYGKFMTEISKRRKPNLIRQLTEAYMKNPDALFFAGGLPNPQMFPFKDISVTYSGGTRMKLENKDLVSALQYGQTQGHPPLLKKWRELQSKWHSPPYADWDVHFVTGSMDGCSKIFELLIEEGTPVMLQTPTYTGILGAVIPMQPHIIPIEMDEDGVLPEDISKACEERLKSGKPLPKFLYVNPTGANPVGTVYSNERKEEIYKLAQKYDFLILEDDAYYFLHFLDEQPRSFLSLDVDGRVLRLDSFSKILSAGIRLGVVTGPKPLLQKIGLHLACSTLHPSSLSQVLVCKLLEAWSEDDLRAHFAEIQRFYRDKRDVMLKVVEKHFTGIAEWSAPKGGMFLWMKVSVMEDVYDLVMETCVPQGVFVLPGHAFYVEGTSKPCPYLRICYSQAQPDDVEEGLAKIAALIRQVAKREETPTINGA